MLWIVIHEPLSLLNGFEFRFKHAGFEEGGFNGKM
jgi:hypothetical protein